jgi:hypothetical protein
VNSGTAGIAAVLPAFQGLYERVDDLGELGDLLVVARYMLVVAHYHFHSRGNQLLDGLDLSVMLGELGFDVALFHLTRPMLVNFGAAGIAASVLTTFQGPYEALHVLGELSDLLGISGYLPVIAPCDSPRSRNQLLDGRDLPVWLGEFGFDLALFHFACPILPSCDLNGKDGPKLKRGRSRPPSLLFLLFFRLAPFALRLQPLLTALGAVRGALHQLGTDQLDHGHLGAIAFPRP